MPWRTPLKLTRGQPYKSWRPHLHISPIRLVDLAELVIPSVKDFRFMEREAVHPPVLAKRYPFYTAANACQAHNAICAISSHEFAEYGH